MLRLAVERLPLVVGMLRLGAESQHLPRERSRNPADWQHLPRVRNPHGLRMLRMSLGLRMKSRVLSRP